MEAERRPVFDSRSTREESVREGESRPRGLAALFPECYREGANRGRELLFGVCAFGMALLFSRTHFFFGMYPFALAYLAAARRRVVPIAAGAVLGAVGRGAVGGVFAGAALLLLFFRFLLSYPAPRRRLFPVTQALFTEGVGLRVLSASLVGALLGLYEILVTGPRPHALYFAAVAVLSLTVLSFLFSGVFEGGVVAEQLLGTGRAVMATSPVPVFFELSLVAMAAALGFSLSGLSLFGLSLSALFAFSATLFAARRFGAARAGVAGLVLGLLEGLSYAPVYAISGLSGGLIFPFGTVYGALAQLVSAALLSGYIEGVPGFLSVLPEGAVATLLLFPVLRRLGPVTDPRERELLRLKMEELAKEPPPPQRGQERLFRLGEAFSSLSALFYRLSDEEKRPVPAEYFMECERVSARYCTTCSNRVACWERGERLAERAMYSLAIRLRDTGRIGEEDLPQALRDRCPRTDEILEDIRDECAAMAMRRHRGDRNEFLSLDYAMLSKLLAEASAADRAEAASDSGATAALQGAAEGELPDGVFAVFGSRFRRVRAVFPAAPSEDIAARLRALGERATGCALTPPRTVQTEGFSVLSMEAAPRYRVEAATAAVPLSGSGDRIRYFPTSDGYFYAVLSDGMGSGEEAARCAACSVDFLEALLEAGASRSFALRMLNNLVRTRREECSATVDMWVFDLLHGHATFIKSGAAPSYIKRGGEVFRISSRTMPLGLAKSPDAERINVEVAVGDSLILLSDGLLPEGEEPLWLMNLLASEEGASPEGLAERILAEAISRIAEPRDDITVGVFRVLEEEAS